MGRLQTKIGRLLARAPVGKAAQSQPPQRGKAFCATATCGIAIGLTRHASRGLANVVQRSLPLQTTAEMTTELRAKLHEVWRAPPLLAA